MKERKVSRGRWISFFLDFIFDIDIILSISTEDGNSQTLPSSMRVNPQDLKRKFCLTAELFLFLLTLTR